MYEQATQAPPIRVAISRLDDAGEELGKRIEALQARLQPILVPLLPAPPTATVLPAGGPRDRLTAPLADELEARADKLLSFAAMLAEFTARLAV